MGFPLSFMTCIMCCISFATFSVLINGSATHYFHVECGLRQGCPLSPLLFLIFMEGLKTLIASTKRDGRLHGLKMSDLCFLTHLLFVDDVLIFLDGSIRYSTTFADIVFMFSRATGMEANHGKSTISPSHTSPHELRFSHQNFPYNLLPLEQGLKYLGF